jgi:cell wall-associated NlpC family hydrolase
MRAFMVRLNVAIVLLAATSVTGCASARGVPAPFPRPGERPAPPPSGTPPEPSPLAGHASGYAVTSTALALRGTPYRNSGADPSGFDCSGFVYYVFAQHGIPVPRTVLEQSRAGRPVAQDDLEPGDLLFFSTVSAGPSHVAIAIGGDEFVHAPSSVGQVRVERLSASYWSSRFVGARRVM